MLAALVLLACTILPGYDYGRASWYGKESSDHLMANGHKFNWHKMTAASRAYPLGTRVEVQDMANGRRVVVEITDRGPAAHLGRLIDLSEAAAKRLHFKGVADVRVMVLRYT